MDAPATALNEHQQRRLIVTCQYVDRLLGDVERVFGDAQSNSPFSRYANDLVPAEQRLVQDYLSRIRTQLVRVLAAQGLAPASHRFGARHSLLTHLAYVDVAIEELKPHYMSGYGAVAPAAEAALNGIVEELQGTLGQLTRYLSVDRNEDFHARLERIPPASDRALLDTLDTVVTKYGLVEFRSALATILDTLERRGLELAVFGRVSTGKSSLLNRLLGGDVLPVGVTPITAVPTRIAYGQTPRLRVWFADAPSRELDISALSAYASERENPANIKRVLRLIVELPSAFLESGMTLVDTPGLGSLATAGAAETLAYLPHCDVAAVLVDAGSTITSEDLGTVGALLDAGVRVSLLLSKADLLTERDREMALTYVRQVLARDFSSARVPVVAVSTKAELDGLFQHWRDSEVQPLVADQERERQRAAARKTEILRGQVRNTLQRLSAADLSTSGKPATLQPGTADTVLQNAAGKITALERWIGDFDLRLSKKTPEILAIAAALIEQQQDSNAALAQAFHQVASDAAQDVTHELQDLLRSLKAACHQVSEMVEWAEQSDSSDRFREVPIPALPPDLHVPAEGVERVLGHSLARSVIAKRLEHALGGVMQSTLEGYAAVLRRWALDSLNGIRAEWAATTDALRADLDRQLGHGERSSIDTQEIERDLQRLTPVDDVGVPKATETHRAL